MRKVLFFLLLVNPLQTFAESKNMTIGEFTDTINQYKDIYEKSDTSIKWGGTWVTTERRLEAIDIRTLPEEVYRLGTIFHYDTNCIIFSYPDPITYSFLGEKQSYKLKDNSSISLDKNGNLHITGYDEYSTPYDINISCKGVKKSDRVEDIEKLLGGAISFYQGIVVFENTGK